MEEAGPGVPCVRRPGPPRLRPGRRSGVDPAGEKASRLSPRSSCASAGPGAATSGRVSSWRRRRWRRPRRRAWPTRTPGGAGGNGPRRHGPGRTTPSRRPSPRRTRGCSQPARPSGRQQSPTTLELGAVAGWARLAAGRALEEPAVTLAVVASVRHVDTGYDELLMDGVDRADARDPSAPRSIEIVERWRVARQRRLGVTRPPTARRSLRVTPFAAEDGGRVAPPRPQGTFQGGRGFSDPLYDVTSACTSIARRTRSSPHASPLAARFGVDAIVQQSATCIDSKAAMAERRKHSLQRRSPIPCPSACRPIRVVGGK